MKYLTGYYKKFGVMNIDSNFFLRSACVFVFLNIFSSSNAQVNNVSLPLKYLDTLNYKELGKLFEESRGEKALMESISNAYLDKAKRENNSVETINAIILKGKSSIDSLKLNYYQEALQKSQEIKHDSLSGISYILLGNYYYQKRYFRNALDNFLEAYNAGTNTNDKNILFIANFNVAVLRDRIGEKKQALEVFKKAYDFAIQNEYKDNKTKRYSTVLFSLANSYRKNDSLEKALYYCDLGLEATKSNKSKNYYNLLASRGVINLMQNQILRAKKDFDSSLQFYKSKSSLYSRDIGYCLFYKAKIDLAQNKKLKAINKLVAVDSIFKINKDIHPELREGYEILINYFKNKKEINEQLYYLKQLVRVDSVLNRNYRYIGNNIDEKLDTPNLIRTQKELEKKLYYREKFVLLIIILFVLVVVTGSIFLIRNNSIFKQYKSKYQELKENSINIAVPKKQPNSYNISSDVVEDIERKINKFVFEKGYLELDISLNSLSKEFNTNPKYLSSYINQNKNKKFKSFLNDLRIEHAVFKIKTDKKFRSYSVKAIAGEIGFSNPISFSNAFRQKTGMKPSEYIRKFSQDESYF